MIETLYPHEQLINIFKKYPFLISIVIAIPLWILGLNIIEIIINLPPSIEAPSIEASQISCASPLPIIFGFILITGFITGFWIILNIDGDD